MYINFVFNIQEHRQEEIKKKGQKKEDFMERIEKKCKENNANVYFGIYFICNYD